MTRIAIIGSCITRDLWPIQGEGVADLLYVSRTSLPSLFAAPVPDLQIRARPPKSMTQYQHRAVVSDLAKRGLASLLEFRPTHIIFDFIDERFDLLKSGPSLVSESWELLESGYLRQPALKAATRIPRLSETCTDRWISAARELACFLAATPLGDARLILHEAQWAETYLDASGVETPFSDVEVLAGRATSVHAHNGLLEDYQSVMLDLLPDMARVASPANRIGDEGHRWGLSPFHYVPAYYDDIRRQLAAAGVVI